MAADNTQILITVENVAKDLTMTTNGSIKSVALGTVLRHRVGMGTQQEFGGEHSGKLLDVASR